MKRSLAATAAIWASLGVVPARAQVPVVDSASILQQVKEYYQELKSYTAQLAQLQQAVQQVQWAASTFGAFVQNPNLGTAMGLMNMAGVSDPLPINPYSVQQLMSGYGGISGKLGALSGLANTTWGQNHVYSPTDSSWASQQLVASGNGLSGAQGTAMQVYQQMSAHFPIIASLRQDLLGANTPAQRESAMAQLQAEQVWAQNAQGQLQAATILASTQQNVQAQRDNERIDKDIDGLLTDAKANGMGIN